MIADTTNVSPNTIRINLNLNLPDQFNCTQDEPIANYLSILICCIRADDQSALLVNDFVLAEGFADFPNFEEDLNKCYVQGNPTW